MSAFAEMNSIFTHRNSLLAQNSVLAGFVESKFEFVRRLDRSRTTETTLSLELARVITPYRLMFIEEPARAEFIDSAAELRRDNISRRLWWGRTCDHEGTRAPIAPHG